MTLTTTPPSADRLPVTDSVTSDPRRQVTWRRLRSGVAGLAVFCLAIGALGTTLGTVVAGRLAEHATAALLWLLVFCVVGGALLDTVGRYAWAGVVDRAEGRLREDLLDAALHQPLAALGEQAVGEVLDRVDDDTHEVGTLVRQQFWMVLRAALSVIPLWIIGAITWWPAWFVFPIAATLVVLVMRPLLGKIAAAKVIEEMAWTDHAAALEESIAGRDDLRTSLGQSFAISRLTKLSQLVHQRFFTVITLERRVTLRAAMVLHLLLAVVLVVGAWLTSRGSLSVGELVTLFLVTSTFVGLIGNVAHQLPDLQAGLGAVIRLRQMLAVAPEPAGGDELPAGGLDLDFRDLHFSYGEGTFALQGITMHVPSGQTVALVGRTGSGKSTLASLISRAVDPEPGSVLIGGEDVLDLDLHALRDAVGVVTQRTEVLAGTLHDNITLFAQRSRTEVEAVVAELGLQDWVAGLPEGLDTLLGPGGTSLSAGEEQLLAFARLLVRDVRVVVLDEATARMDPLTEALVVAASARLLRGRTGILVAHRLSTIARADLVAALDHGRLVQFGPRTRLASEPGPFRDLLTAADVDHTDDPATVEDGTAVGGARRRGTPPERADVGTGPSLARGIAHALSVTPRWGLLSIGLFAGFALTGALGAITGYLWGHTVQSLRGGQLHWPWVIGATLSVLIGPYLLAEAISRYPRWWVEILLRVRMSVLLGQTAQRRLTRTPPGEVVARAMDADRYARYADRWVDFCNGLLIALVTAIAGGTYLAGLVLLAVMVCAALASAVGRPVAGRSAAQASAARARFGRALVSTLESVRTIKLAGRTPQVHRHLREVDGGRVDAAVREHRVQAVLDGVPIVMVQLGAVAAWAALLGGVWGLATTLLVVNAVNGFDWFGRVAGSVVTEAPGTRAWQKVTSRMAGGTDLTRIPADIDLIEGRSPEPPQVQRIPLQTLTLRGLGAVHDDGTIGVSGADLQVQRGELVLLLGQVGSGKSSLLSALAGLLDHTGSLQWNGIEVEDAEVFLRPGQVAHVAQVPRVLSGSFADNVQLGFGRDFDQPVADARLGGDVADAGGPLAIVGHRGVRLSGGQVQRLALARALATDAELLLADDVSSALDARTEIELWAALRQRATTVIGATSKRAALAQADRVVVLVDGQVAAVGPWQQLSPDWAHLAG
ncbi:ABC transporter ATP-binding protein [Calidifontibacter sp. DB0510]|uniref:ABC transporter ATP-binding protein n=1 Tax=Metallococcus carri TaxID=1656884 RepID=A0A967E8G9_9MICO|nr:ABC transporter ATP-binding protein [Metallococcus carri]NHN55202.1 ABC transporter ATP-binding protein [Metallococcus carri]NOP36279.1 ABC transporter ATP-binding protein [Calidifontibacter sp. DB2511S]